MSNKFIDRYANWLKENSFEQELAPGLWKIKTPYMDLRHDLVEIFIQEKPDKSYRLTDDAYSLSDLEASGFELESEKRKDLFNAIIRSYGVKYNESNNELYLETTLEELPQRKHDFTQCIREVGDLFHLTVNLSPFLNVVKTFFDEHDIAYSEHPRVRGVRCDNRFDFSVVVVKNHERTQNLIDAVNYASHNDTIESVLWRFEDIQPVQNYHGILAYNDNNGKVNSRYQRSLEELKVTAIPWSEKEEILSYLKA